MKRLLVLADWPRVYNGGVSRVVVETCRRLAGRGYEIGIAHHMDGPSEIDGPSWQLPDTFVAPPERMVAAMTRVLDEFKPDLMQAHTRRGTQVLDLILSRTAACQYLHDQSYFCSGGHRMTRGYQPCHRPHGISCFLYHYLLGCGGKNPRHNWDWWKGTEFFTPAKKHPSLRLQVASRLMQQGLLENGYPEERIDLIPLYSEPATVPDATEPGRILVPGRLVREKGVHVVVEAMALLRDLPWRLIMPGQGPEAGRLREHVASLGLADRFEFPGEIGIDAMNREYSRAELVVFPVLRYEPFGLIGPEAMAYGKPIVAFGGGGVDEWLWPDETGILVKERTPQALAAGVRSVLGSPQLRARLSEGARRHYPVFHPDAYLDRLEVSFEKTLAGWKQARR